jgi:molybdenum cofactor cytidylyltransferase
MEKIAAIVLAAGLSSRMQTPKMVLPWGDRTIIAHVVGQLVKAGIEDVVVVTGGTRLAVEEALKTERVRIVFNPVFANGEMLNSLQVGIRALPEEATAFLMALGDQPQMDSATIAEILAAYPSRTENLIIPSYQMRRGHPWLVGRDLWDEILSLTPPDTLRTFLNRRSEQIQYISVNSASILQDLDTPEEYRSQRPASNG